MLFSFTSDTPQFEGPPVVHAVKDSSVIADLIQVGDKLVAVDDEDVTNMTAIKVSKLISRKSANPLALNSSGPKCSISTEKLWSRNFNRNLHSSILKKCRKSFVAMEK